MLENLRAKLKGAYIEKVKGECVFCKLIEDDADKIIYQDEDLVVFPPLKSGALKEGHLLVVPRNHVENIYELNEDEITEYFKVLTSLISKVEEKSRYGSVNLLSANGKDAQQSIEHLHFHAVLRNKSEDYDLWPDTKYKGENFEEVNRELKNLLD